MKKWLVFASVLGLALVIAACGANSGDNKEVAGEAVQAGAEEAATSEVTVTASNWEFDQEEYKINAGETVNITVKSVGVGAHGVQILKSNYKIGNNQTVAVKFDKPGTYEMICSIPCGTGHRAMKAKLVVV